MKQIYPNLKRLTFIIMCCLSPIFLFAQTKITGTVNDETKQPLPGVSVMLKGTTQGTTTDVYGRFIINAIPGQVLVFRFIGFADQEAVVGNGTSMVVNLKG